jgi:hypothetical protein
MNLASGVALGVDWSGARAARRKIWVARLVVDGAMASVESVRRPFAALRRGRGITIAEIADEFVPWLGQQSFNVAGLDFCFGPWACGAFMVAMTARARVPPLFQDRKEEADVSELGVEGVLSPVASHSPHTCHTSPAGWQPVVAGHSRFARRGKPCSSW